MRPVRFVRSHPVGNSLYLAGEVAGFRPEVTARLIAARVAEYADGATHSEAAPNADPPQNPSPAADTGAASGLLSTTQDGAPVMTPLPPVDPAAEAAAVRAESVSRTDRKNKRDRR